MVGSVVAQMPLKGAVKAHKGPTQCAAPRARAAVIDAHSFSCPQFRERRNTLCPNPSERCQPSHFGRRVKALNRLSQPEVRMRLCPKKSSRLKGLRVPLRCHRRRMNTRTTNLAARCHLFATPWSRLHTARRADDRPAARFGAGARRRRRRAPISKFHRRHRALPDDSLLFSISYSSAARACTSKKNITFR